jgi:lipopolysaccharide biosynthesis glycosyltransferase
MKNSLDIALGFDVHYAPHAAAVIASVVRHTRDSDIRFILLHSGVDDALQLRVERTAPNARFVWIEVGDDDIPPFADRGHFKRATLFRLGLEKLAPSDCNRVLYLDSDTIALRDLKAVWNTDLGDHPIGAVIDAYVDPIAFAKRWDLSPQFKYFNAGVLLIDLARIRSEKLFSAATEFVAKHDRDLPYNDQDALNWALWGRWKNLGASWNVQRFLSPKEIAGEQTEERRLEGKRPYLVHFIGYVKPWQPNVWHPWSWLYWENLARTSFSDDVARRFGMNAYQLARLRLRWWVKRPRGRLMHSWRGERH